MRRGEFHGEDLKVRGSAFRQVHFNDCGQFSCVVSNAAARNPRQLWEIWLQPGKVSRARPNTYGNVGKYD